MDLDTTGQVSVNIESDGLLELVKEFDMKAGKKILTRVRNRFNHELDGGTPHISHDSFTDHTDTVTVPHASAYE